MTKPKKNLLIVSIALCALFFVFTVLVATVDKAAGNAPGTEIGFSHLNLAFFNATHKNGEISNGWYKLTEFLGYLALAEAAGFAVYGVAQLIVRKSLKKIDKDLFVLAAAYVLLAIFYVAFEKIVVNYRPVLENGEIAASYPSSHTMLTITIASTGIFMLRRRMSCRPALISAETLSGAVMLVMTVGRLLSGVHYFTDILGGVLLAAAIVTLFAAFLPENSAQNVQAAEQSFSATNGANNE